MMEILKTLLKETFKNWINENVLHINKLDNFTRESKVLQIQVDSCGQKTPNRQSNILKLRLRRGSHSSQVQNLLQSWRNPNCATDIKTNELIE